MTFATFRRPAIRAALASLTSAVLIGLLSSEVQAGCGRYAHSSETQHASSGLHAWRLLQLDTLERLSQSLQAPPASGEERPCSGPRCSNRSQPAEIPVTQKVELEQDWCLALCDADLVPGQPAHVTHPEPSALPILAPGSIERPPRGR